jgi:hypothetical protein
VFADPADNVVGFLWGEGEVESKGI